MFILNFYCILTAYQLLTAVKLSQKVNFGSLRKGYECKFTASHCPPPSGTNMIIISPDIDFCLKWHTVVHLWFVPLQGHPDVMHFVGQLQPTLSCFSGLAYFEGSLPLLLPSPEGPGWFKRTKGSQCSWGPSPLFSSKSGIFSKGETPPVWLPGANTMLGDIGMTEGKWGLRLWTWLSLEHASKNRSTGLPVIISSYTWYT